MHLFNHKNEDEFVENFFLVIGNIKVTEILWVDDTQDE